MIFLEKLKKRNRTLLEMHMGMAAFGLLCQAVGIWFVDRKGIYSLSLWLGILLAGLAAVHMYRSLDRSLGQGDRAVKLIFRDYLIRYVLFAAILLMIIVTGKLNPLAVFLGYMGLKVSALIQPFTHKLCNRIFQETDPVPEPIPEDGFEDGSEERMVPSGETEDLSAGRTDQSEETEDLSEEKKDLPAGEIELLEEKIDLSKEFEETGKEV